jgi:hypothetical protein
MCDLSEGVPSRTSPAEMTCVSMRRQDSRRSEQMFLTTREINLGGPLCRLIHLLPQVRPVRGGVGGA